MINESIYLWDQNRRSLRGQQTEQQQQTWKQGSSGLWFLLQGKTLLRVLLYNKRLYHGTSECLIVDWLEHGVRASLWHDDMVNFDWLLQAIGWLSCCSAPQTCLLPHIFPRQSSKAMIFFRSSQDSMGWYHCPHIL